jgi:antitoxin VapB
MVETAKIFWSGRSQAVRLPKEYRFDTEEVRIRRRGGSVILDPLPKDWAWLDSVTGAVDADFEKAVEEELPQQVRPDLDLLE